MKNKGFEIQEIMMGRYDGSVADDSCYDFHDNHCLYEVKSTHITRICTNGNCKRNYVHKHHKKVITRQYGKFMIYLPNHHKMLKIAKGRKKKAAYIFVVWYKDNMIIRVMSASRFNMKETTGWVNIPISQVFR